MSKIITFAIIAAYMAAETAAFNLPQIQYGKSYNDIPHKHRKNKRGKPK